MGRTAGRCGEYYISFYVVSNLKVDIVFVSAVCRELFKCCNSIQRALNCSFVAMVWQCAFNKITLYVNWAA